MTMRIKSNKELSFSALVDKGVPKEEIMRFKGLTEREYEKSLESLREIRSRPKNETHKSRKRKTIDIIAEPPKNAERDITPLDRSP